MTVIKSKLNHNGPIHSLHVPIIRHWIACASGPIPKHHHRSSRTLRSLYPPTAARCQLCHTLLRHHVGRNTVMGVVLMSTRVLGLVMSHPNKPRRGVHSRISGHMESDPPMSTSTSIARSPFVMPPPTLRCAPADLESSLRF